MASLSPESGSYESVTRPVRSDPDRLAAVVRAALGHKSRAGFTKLIQTVAEVAELDGCVLWLPTPGTILDKQNPEGSLYVGAQWFRTGATWAIHDLELDNVTGQAMIAEEVAYVQDCLADDRVDHEKQFFGITKTRSFVSVPIEFLDVLPPMAALCAYKQRPYAFSREQQQFVIDCAHLLPDLWRTVLDSVSLHLMEAVSMCMRAVDLGAQAEPLDLTKVRGVLQDICWRVGDSLLAHEVSIFMRDWLAECPDQFELQATTYPTFAATGPYPVLDPMKCCPIGLTPWVLFHNKPIQVFDLGHWNRDLHLIRKTFQDVAWYDPANVISIDVTARRPGGERQPVSFMAAPIPSKSGPLGAIRCVWAKEPPYFYSAAETELLGRVAVQLSNFWNAWMGQRELAQGLQRLRNVQADISHQLKTPLNSANSTLRGLCKRSDDGSGWLSEAKKARSAVARSRSVVTSIRVYEELHRTGRVELRKADYPVWRLRELAEEAAETVKIALDPDRQLGVRSDHSGLDSAIVPVDLDLYEQLLYILLDNASKYTYKGTSIHSATGFTGKGKYYAFTVKNASERIQAVEVKKLSERGFRTELAKLWTQEGSGLGLWIAKHVMDAHKGELRLNSERGGWFEARLLFPAS